MLGLAVLAGLAWTNPEPVDFESFAAGRLVTVIEAELCHKPSLPLMLQLVVNDCAELVRGQRQALGVLAREHSRRLNLGVASLYSTRLGGQQLLSDWRLPVYSVTTVGVAGQFVVLQTSTTP